MQMDWTGSDQTRETTQSVIRLLWLLDPMTHGATLLQSVF